MYDNFMDKISRWWGKVLCRMLGHKMPYVEKFTALICGRCRLVIEDRPKYHKVGATILELKKKSYRIKKRGF